MIAAFLSTYSFHRHTLCKLSSVTMKICNTCEDIQYPWEGSSVPVRHICSTCEDMHYSHINTCEDIQYPWGDSVWMKSEWSFVLQVCLVGSDDLPHGYWWPSSRVLKKVHTGLGMKIYILLTTKILHEGLAIYKVITLAQFFPNTRVYTN